jgi:hypothetical protein
LRKATDDDFKILETGDGEWLCWAEWGGACSDSDDIDNVIIRIKEKILTELNYHHENSHASHNVNNDYNDGKEYAFKEAINIVERAFSF